MHRCQDKNRQNTPEKGHSKHSQSEILCNRDRHHHLKGFHAKPRIHYYICQPLNLHYGAPGVGTRILNYEIWSRPEFKPIVKLRRIFSASVGFEWRKLRLFLKPALLPDGARSLCKVTSACSSTGSPNSIVYVTKAGRIVKTWDNRYAMPFIFWHLATI